MMVSFLRIALKIGYKEVSVVRKLRCCAFTLLLEIMVAEEEFDRSDVVVECLGK
jgi:hypothetical protein